MLNFEKKRKKFLLAFSVPFGVFFFISVQADMSEIKSIEVAPDMHNILIEWKKSLLQETEGVMIIRKEKLCPGDAFDGENIYQGNGNSFIDKNAKKNTPYCYGAFVYDSSGAVSDLKKSDLVRTKSWSEYFGMVLEDNIFFGVGFVLIAILGWLNISKRRGL